jgi:periplasmic protein CpxP/Spy
MNTASPGNAGGPSFRRSLFTRYTALAFLAGAILTAGLGGLAVSEAMNGWHNGMMMDGTHSPAEVSAHVDHMLKHLYVEIDATDAQKAQIGPLVQQAVKDLMPLHAQLQTAHTHAMQALTEPTLDRASLEAARVEHLQLADQASKRFVQLIADVGEVLTPAQRQSLSEHLERLHGSPHP